MKKVSVIVPAYNAHETLARCLGSLVNQTLQDIEIIVVNDCSQDDTWEIMQRCKNQFPDKVEIINSTINRGPGGARNIGFDRALGEYIGLVDSDDYVVPQMYELLYEEAKRGNYDIVDSGYYREATDEAKLFTGDNVIGKLDDLKRNTLISAGGYLVTKIFKNELWNDPIIRMRENVLCLEDSEILTYMFMRANSMGNVKEILYKYCDTFGSATKEIELEVYIESICGAMRAIYEITSALENYDACKEAIEYEIAQLYVFGVNRCLMRSFQKNRRFNGNVEELFVGLDENETGKLNYLRELAKSSIKTPYKCNRIIVQKISKLDLDIIEVNDKR